MEDKPRVFMLNAEELLKVRSQVFVGDERFVAADQSLLETANAALATRPFSVAEKEDVPPSKNRQDYMSLAPEWWPDPAVENGYPYQRREGEVNDECERYDHPRLVALCASVSTLSTAYFFSDFEDYAERAALLLRTFFLDEHAGMNPNLAFGQAIRGRCQGRVEGIMDTYGFSWLVDHVGLLVNSASWNADDQADLEDWFSRYLDWLLESELGIEAQQRRDIHGICYDVQISALALFCRRVDVARQAVVRAQERLFNHVDPDGSQPLEMEGARSLDRCMTSIGAFFDVADLGKHVDCTLWSGSEGLRLHRAFFWLLEQGFDAQWSSGDEATPDPVRWLPLLRRAARHWADEGIEDRLRSIDREVVRSDWTYLLYPTSER